MNLRPWALWSKEGDPAPQTEEILEILENTIQNNPPHPGIYHLYIHVIEMSQFPERALDVANKLGKYYSDFGHLLHMPSHIYVRVGNYKDAITCNLQAIEADLKYFNLRVRKLLNS